MNNKHTRIGFAKVFSLYLVQVSITFDPFSIIQVPIPKEKKLIRVIFMSAVPSNRPIMVKTLHI